jgi:hypothetical protein
VPLRHGFDAHRHRGDGLAGARTYRYSSFSMDFCGMRAHGTVAANSPGMGRSPSIKQPPAAPGLERPLIREVGHAAGNLFHRIQYCASVLEDHAPEGIGAETLGQLRLSVDELQRLIGRTMDLLRPADARTSVIPIEDVLGSLALRFALAHEEPGGVASSHETRIDPSLLDRAFAVLTEIASPSAGDVARVPLAVRVRGTGSAVDVVVALRVCKRAAAASTPHANVHDEVGLALALKLLEESGCACDIARDADATTIEISLRVVEDAASNARALRDARSSRV